MPKIILASRAGFCFGVRRAMDMALEQEGKAGVYTLGPLIHNPQVVEALQSRGVGVCQNPEELRQGETVIIRSHGVDRRVTEALQARGVHVLDATCPFVRRIQEKAASCAREDIPVILVGEAQHPEVLGILGWCGPKAWVVNGSDDLEALPPMEKACIMAQTTTPEARWQSLVQLAGKKVERLEVFSSICSATSQRQEEAIALAEQCQAMVVIGGKNSSNTRKLYELASSHCAHVWWVQEARELPRPEVFGQYSPIALVSGASTPDWIIKEVFTSMSEIDNKALDQTAAVQDPQTDDISVDTRIPRAGENGEVNFAEDFDKMMVQIRPGQVITGKVVSVSENEVCVNIGYKSDGFISRAEFSANEDVNPLDVVKEGDDIEVEVLKVNDGEGNVLLSKKNIDSRKHWKEVMENFTEGSYITAEGKQAVKGGLICSANGIRAFVPASQLDTKYVEDISGYVGKTMTLKVIEVEKHRKRFVASRKAVLLEEAEAEKNAKWEKIVEGSTVTGIVRRLTDFGAFVDIGGVDGLVHVTNLSWGRVQHPKEVVSVGQELECLVLKADKEHDRISLGHKQLLPKPWEVANQKYIPGSVVTGKVVRIVSFGAFVELEPGLDGLVHISQIADRRIDKVESALSVGQVVNVKVLDINPADRRISLSIRDAETTASESDYSLDDYDDVDTDETPLTEVEDLPNE